MAISLTEFSHDAVPITSTPNKLANDITTPSLTNGDHSVDYDDELNQVHLSPAKSSPTGHQQPSTSFLETGNENIVLDSKTKNTSDECNSALIDTSSEFLQQTTIESEEDSANFENDTDLTDYICHQNAENGDEASCYLKERLLLALTKLIPHRESLSLRLLVNYTVDGEDSDCIVIDETLCRRSGAEKHSNSEVQDAKLTNNKRNDSQRESVYSCEPDNKRRRLHQLLYKDSPALDLSLPVDSMNEAMHKIMNKLECKTNTAPRDTIGETTGVSNEGLQTALHLLNAPNNTSQFDQSLRQVISNSGLLAGTGVLNGGFSIPNTSTGIPLIDPSIISLLPLLQHQQKQQLKQPNQLLNSINLPGLGEHPFSSPLLIPPEITKENLLIKELQSLIQNTSNVNTVNNNAGINHNGSNFGSMHSSINNITANLIKQCEKPNGDFGNSSSGVAGAGFVNSPSCSTTNPVLSLPLFNAFSADQLCALFPSNPFIGQPVASNVSTGAVKNSLTTTTANNLPSILHNMQQQQQPNTTNPATNFTSLNIGSATLLNLRDKITGLETLGIMPATGNKPLPQPVANLLNQFGQHTTSTPASSSIPASSASVSFRALSSLSQLFNSMTSTTATLPQLSSASYPSSLLAATPGSGAMYTTTPSSTSAPPMNFTLPQATLFPTSLNGTVNSMTTTPTLTMLPNVLPSSDMVAILNSLNGTCSSDTNRLVTLESLTAAVNRIKRQRPGNRLLSTSLGNNCDATIPVALTSGMKSDMLRLVSSPGPCGESFESSSPSASNLMFGRRLLNARRFICNQCRRNYTSLAELNRHTLEAHNSFKCTICSAHFTQRSNLQRHSLKHVGFKPFTCNLCKKEYYRKDHLVRHIEVTHPNQDPKMNITVHLTSSECLEYLDRINTGKQTPSPGDSEIQRPDEFDTAEEDPLKIAEDNVEEPKVKCDEPITPPTIEALKTDEPLTQTPPNG